MPKLDGIRVLDLSAFLPGPYASMMMADHGAEVIMVEPDNGRGEPTRAMGETYEDGTSVWFSNIARCKKSYRVNLKDEGEYTRFLELADTADVVIEAFRPGVVRRLRVDYDTLSARNPGLVYCSISAFGQGGRYAAKPAHDLVVQAMAGTADLTRGRRGEPTFTPMPSADMAASTLALSGILMALLARERTGEGDYLDISMYHALLSWVPNVTGSIFAHNEQPKREAMRNFGGNAFVNIYETRNGGHIALGGSEPKFVANFLRAVHREDLLPATRKPVGEQQALIADMEALFKTRTQGEWEALLADVDCCWSPIRTLHTALTEDEAPVRVDASGKRHIENPIRFARDPARASDGLPGYGEHTEALRNG